MDWLKGEYSKLISFVSAKNLEKQTKQNAAACGQNKVDGKEVRHFYEELINDSTIPECDDSSNSVPVVTLSTCTARTHQKNTDKFREGRNTSVVTKLDLNRYLRYAQEGNLKSMKTMLDKGVPLNYNDEFGWTALMCASHSGQMDIAKYILSVGADKDVNDRHGKNATDIAESCGYLKLANFIRKWNTVQSASELSVNSADKELFHCDACKSNFMDCSQKEHESSTVHLFNLKKKAKEDPFLLPSSNKGYKMMLRSGWDGIKGLGSEGQGQKYPVKTLLKRDRKCLGTEKSEKPKITHFNANDMKSIVKNPKRKLSKRVINKRQQRAKERKRRQWEQNLRTSMSLDV